ncbi:RNA 2',3'-cyclic phosphodiesterase [Montanilutibacter psychrotolerans]|uniref:RNA 2',3'-cyclic phosphodiesterase n=1 Tax=Montanilutibacter psychrotolerans TaxID=1327343 RepID=A0A3M8T196_9GAMM|nr:RNA 2',3'-cyclic phosphodiesterase [Lysobacter psychrotolerans]RNF85264.1 RNA 2',3'-cyclic phosphodiesterase [Lysobacter psychrotolerans]
MPSSDSTAQPGRTGHSVVPARGVQRLFFALWPDEATRMAIHAEAMRLQQARAPGGRWIDRHRYHMTLQFLGDFASVPPSLMGAALAAGGHVRAPAFEFVLDVAGSFGKLWWLGCDAMPDGLALLWQQLGAALESQGVRPRSEHGLTPHVTVMRHGDRALRATPIAPLPWAVSRFVLIRSEQGARNAYDLLGQWPLGKA